MDSLTDDDSAIAPKELGLLLLTFETASKDCRQSEERNEVSPTNPVRTVALLLALSLAPAISDLATIGQSDKALSITLEHRFE